MKWKTHLLVCCLVMCWWGIAGAFGSNTAQAQVGSLTPEQIALNHAHYHTFERIEKQFKAGESLQTLPELLELLDHELDRSREAAVGFLKKLGPAAAPALPKLEWLLENDESMYHGRLFDCIGAIGEESLPLLIKLTEHEKDRYRAQAVKKIGQIGIRTPETLAAVRKRLDDEADSVRRDAFLVAGQLKDVALERRLLQVVEQALKKEYVHEQAHTELHAAAEGLVAMNQPGSAPVGKAFLTKFMRHALRMTELDEGNQQGYRTALEEYKSYSILAYPAVIEGMTDSHWRVRVESVKIAERWGNDIPELADAVIEAVTDENLVVRLHAATALGNFTTAKTLPTIERRLRKEPVWAVRYHLLHALYNQQTDASLALLERHNRAYNIGDPDEHHWIQYEKNYPNLYRHINEPWASIPLANLAEPELSSKSDDYAFRFLFADAGFSSTDIYRVYMQAGKPHFIHKHYGHGFDVFWMDRPLEDEEWERLKRQIDAVDLGHHRKPEFGLFADGLVWILEEVVDGHYYAMQFRNPEKDEKPLRELRATLERLAAQPEPDHDEATE